MYTSRLATILFSGVALGCAGTGSTGMPQAEEAADVAAIEALMETELATLVAGDVEGNLALLAEGALILPPDEPPVAAADAGAWMAAFLETTNVTAAEYLAHDIHIHGDAAVDYYHGRLTMMAEGAEEPILANMKGLHVLHRQADGSWKIVYDIWNADGAGPSQNAM